MKIGIFLEADLAKPGGVQEYARGLYDYLEKTGHQVCLIVPGRVSKEKEKRRVKSLGKRWELKKLAWLEGTSVPGAITFARIGQIKAFLKKENFAVIHFQAPFGLLAYQLLWALRQEKTVKVATFHVYRESNLIPFLVNFSVGPFLRWLARNLDVKIAVSQAAQEFSQKMIPGKYVIIPNAVDFSRFHPQGEKIKKFLDAKLNILFVGRLDSRKGVLPLLQAFFLVKEKFPAVRLIIVGLSLIHI